MISFYNGIVTEIGLNVFSAEMTEPGVSIGHHWTEYFFLDEVFSGDREDLCTGAALMVTKGLRTEGGIRERFSRIEFEREPS